MRKGMVVTKSLPDMMMAEKMLEMVKKINMPDIVKKIKMPEQTDIVRLLGVEPLLSSTASQADEQR
jgi:EAL domain-containing protein (putative c-di-GMP-specific phosphodiesterase class I)